MATEFNPHKSEDSPAATTAAAAEPTRSGPVFRPNVDILEREDELTVLADLPGAKADQIDVQFENGMLTIQARVPERYEKDAEWLWREFETGDFYRTFRVSEEIDPAKIRAEYADGVLTLHLPKSDAARPRKIPVSVG